jgi:hypothetical protein
LGGYLINLVSQIPGQDMATLKNKHSKCIKKLSEQAK